MKYFRDYMEHLTPDTQVNSNTSLETKIKEDVYNNSVYMTNTQRRIISKTDDIITKTNKKLEDQLNTLSNIESEIFNKDKLIKMNNTEYQNKIIYTNLLKKGILLLACSLPFVFMISAYSGTILWNRFFMILIILCVMYIIYSFYTFNTLNAQTVISPQIDKMTGFLNAMADEVISEGKLIDDKLREFINYNCDCPDKNDKDDNKESGEPDMYNAFDYLTEIETNDGFYYYDGTAPQQRLIKPVNSLGKNNTDYKGPCPANWVPINNKCEPPTTYKPLLGSVCTDISQNMTEIQKKEIERNCNVKWPLKNNFRIDWEVAPDFGIRDTGIYMNDMNTDPPVPPIYPIPNIYENFGEPCNVGEFCNSIERGTVFKCVKENRISMPKCVAQYSDTMWRPGSLSGDFGLPRAGGLTNTESSSNTMRGHDLYPANSELTSDESQTNMNNPNNISTYTVFL